MYRDIVRRLNQVQPLREIAVEFRIPNEFAHSVAANSGIDYVGKQLDRHQEAEIRSRREVKSQSIREIGREMGLPSRVGILTESHPVPTSASASSGMADTY